MKKDIFNGNIKKEYFSYILFYLIFFLLLFVGVGAMLLGVGLWANEGSRGAIIFMRILGVSIITMGFAGFVACLLVIRKYPKYEKIRRILYNSDVYFTESTSYEYFGDSKTLRGRKNKAAFDMVTIFAEAEKGTGSKKPVRYAVYCALALFMVVLGFIDLIAMPLLFDNGIVFPNMSDGIFAFLCTSVALVCIAFAIFFLVSALKVGIMSPLDNRKWAYELYSSLVDISVRQNNKKLKFWYDKDQLEHIEGLVKSASGNAELKLETKGNKLASFKVVDTLDQRVIFTGLFI